MNRIVATWILLMLLAMNAQVVAADAQIVAGLRVLEHSGGDIAAQDLTPFPLGTWHNNDHLWWRDAKPGDRLQLELPVKTAGRQELSVVLTRAGDYGVVRFLLDGQVISGAIDAYATIVTQSVPISLGVHDLTVGPHKLTVEIVGSNEKSTGHLFGLDRILLRASPLLDPSLADVETAALDVLTQIDRLPRLRDDVQCEMFSSYDRTGGNNDGFSGDYSKLWIEDGNSVLAAMDGPGCIQRIWFTHSEHRSDGLLNLKGEHIKVYADHGARPVLDVSLEDLFSGRLPQFPKPLVGEGQGGYYCYVPIPYRDGCRVVIEGTGVRFYQITYSRYDDPQQVSTFQAEMSAPQQESLARAVRLWSNLGDVDALRLEDSHQTNVDLALAPGESTTVDLPNGPGMVRAVLLEGPFVSQEGTSDATLEFSWDDADEAAVRLPLEYFFLQASETPPFQSLFAGNRQGVWYNFLPMPYRSSAGLTITCGKALQGKLTVVTVPLEGVDESLAYLHSSYQEGLPAIADEHHTFLQTEGAGHYVGTYLVTEGQTDRRLPLWLEGDDRFTVDGRLVIHGTGSEDYFNCGWYAVEGRLNGPGGCPQHGFPVYRLTDERNHAVAYRWHLTDPIYYTKSITAEMEHGADNRQEADYRSAAFYYTPNP